VADIEWVLLRSFADQTQANLLGEFLGNQGIQVSVEGAFASGVLPGVEGTRVMVPGDCIEAFDGTRDDLPTPIPGV